MRRIRRFLRLPARDRRLVLRAAVLIAVVRPALAVLPLRVVRRWLTRGMRPALARSPAPSTERVVWAVAAAARLVPATTCLTRALVAEVLLAQSGHAAELRIGVAKTDQGTVEAHAWVESEGRVLVGALPDLSRYAPLPPLPTAPSTDLTP